MMYERIIEKGLLDKWVLGDFSMFAIYLAAIYMVFYIPPDAGYYLFKYAVTVILPIAFYFHIKQDYDVLEALVKKLRDLNK